jgi:hypothetical protein
MSTKAKIYLFSAWIAVVPGGCHLSTLGTLHPSEWFVKSVKTDAQGDVITLLHADKVYVARCKGEKFATDERIYLGTSCPYLTQHVGVTFENGDGIGQISRPVSDIVYLRDKEKQSYEVWEVVEETAK